MCYLGWGTLAVLGLIDASECNPTFGAGETQVGMTKNAPHSTEMCLFLCLCPEDYEDIRGFIAGGYVELDNNEGPLTSLVGLKTLTIKIKTSYFTVLCALLLSTVEIPIKVPFLLLWPENGLKCL